MAAGVPSFSADVLVVVAAAAAVILVYIHMSPANPVV
jgi:hypothetical protein